MKITKMDTYIVNIPYTHDEVSSRIIRGGVTAVIVKLSADNGLVGWGESCGNIADAASIEQAVQTARPFVIESDPWQRAALARDFFKRHTWDLRMPSANFAFAGIDHALWDICGKECGQPLYRLLGGALRSEVNYFYYLARGDAAEIRQQAAEGVRQGYTAFYLKVGLDRQAEERMLQALRDVIGPDCRIRIDANTAWTVNESVRILRSWDQKFGIDFCEAPVPHDLTESLSEVRDRVPCAISANEGLVGEAAVFRAIHSRCADVLCFSPYWVGSLSRFLALSYVAHHAGLQVCKHTHGELGIAATAAHHAMLCIPNAVMGNQQTATIISSDILTAPIPISEGPTWGLIEAPGLGIEVDEEKIALGQEAYVRDGQFVPYRLN